jgi:hypothetical protein
MAKAKTVFFKPYNREDADTFYNQLFGDNYVLFQPRDNQPAEGRWKTLLTVRASAAALRKIAEDQASPAIQRIIAVGRLRGTEIISSPSEMLAVLVESGEEDGMDTLAVYADGTVKFISAEGKVSHLDGTRPITLKKIAELMSMAQQLTTRMEAWAQPRLSPPIKSMVRLTFIATDGYFFGQGEIRILAKDRSGGPIIRQASAIFADIMSGEKKSNV